MDNIEGLIKPKGTDLYDISIYNENLNILEDNINWLLNFCVPTEYLYFVTGQINVDTVAQGYYICDNLGTLEGTYPSDSSKTHFVLLCLINATQSISSSMYQMYTDLETNKIYIRTRVKGQANWSTWTSVTGNGGFSVQYPTSIDIDNVDTGIYILDNHADTVSGTFPDDFEQYKAGFQLITYGSESAESKIITQELIATVDNNSKNIRYIRSKYIFTTGSSTETCVWSNWDKLLTSSDVIDMTEVVY